MRIRNRLAGIVFLLVIFCMMLRVVIAYIPLGYEYLFSEPAFDTLTAYPYADTDTVSEADLSDAMAQASRTYAVFNRLKSLVVDYMGSMSSYYFADFVIGKRMADRVMGLDMTASSSAGETNENNENVVAVWQDDYLGYIIPDTDNTFLIESIADFGKRMEQEGRDFLFFLTPSKQTQSIAYPDYSEIQRTQLLQGVREQELDMIDITEVLVERQIDMKDIFFKTDHHWLPSTGIWADQLLCEFMNENYGYRIDTSIFNPENYDTVIVEDSFLGTQGRKVTTAYCEKEDFPVVVPKYNTDLEVFVSGKNETYTGSIQDTLFDYEQLEASISNAYRRNAYRFYGYNNQALITVHNNDMYDGSCVLVIKSSFADVMIPYLSAVIEDLYVIDLRYFNGSLRTFIDEADPDTVVIVAGSVEFVGNGFSGITGK